MARKFAHKIEVVEGKKAKEKEAYNFILFFKGVLTRQFNINLGKRGRVRRKGKLAFQHESQQLWLSIFAIAIKLSCRDTSNTQAMRVTWGLLCVPVKLKKGG